MKETSGNRKSKKAYSYEVTKIEVLDGQTTKPLSVSSRKSNTPNDSHGLNSELEAHDLNDLDRAAKGLLPLAKVINNVEKSYDSGKQILDESRIADESGDLYRDPDETEDIWTDGSLGFDEQVTRAAVRLAGRHRESAAAKQAAYREIGGNLTKQGEAALRELEAMKGSKVDAIIFSSFASPF